MQGLADYSEVVTEGRSSVEMEEKGVERGG